MISGLKVIVSTLSRFKKISWMRFRTRSSRLPIVQLLGAAVSTVNPDGPTRTGEYFNSEFAVSKPRTILL